MAIGWDIPTSSRYRPAPAAAVLVAAAIAVLAVLAILAVTDHRPLTPVQADAGRHLVGGAQAGAQTATTATVAEASARATPGRADASSEHSVTVSDGSGGLPAGVVVTNSGSATADVGGNVVVGSDRPDGSSASVSTGDATAVGNQSSVWVGP
jgi:hypothetical protein